MTSGLYDLLDAGFDHADIEAWLLGSSNDAGRLPRLSVAERRILADAWWFWGRPGQVWQPGPEFITDMQCGRGFGKSISAAEVIAAASREPERWGGQAVIVGVNPTQVKRDCLVGPSGVFAAAMRAAASGNGPGIRDQNWNDRCLWFEAPRGGGKRAGLTVHWAAASDPKSVHGLNVGLVWWDEFGVADHAKRDMQGNNAWSALLPAVRAAPSGGSKVIITQTPSRAAEVRRLQADAERPECPACRTVHLAKGPYRGEPLQEPWRLPRSPQRRLHRLLNTRTTEPVRACPTCGAEVVARVRTVFGDTRDNPHIDSRAREDADRELATGQSWAFLRFSPRGEIDSRAPGSLVIHEHIRDLHLRLSPGTADPWGLLLADLGAEEIIVQVDPATTATETSADTGLGAACLRREPVTDRPQVVGLVDWSVRPDEVQGAPSTVWAPRAVWLAALVGARRIVVETNNGGEEVLAPVRALLATPPTEPEVLARLAELMPALPRVALSAVARRVAMNYARIEVESVTRRARKPVRWGWYGESASRGEQALLGVEFEDERLAALPLPDGAHHWATLKAQLTGFEPRHDAREVDERKDRADWLIAAGQVLLGVVESKGRIIEPQRDRSFLLDGAHNILR